MYYLYRSPKFKSIFFLSCQRVFDIQIWIFFMPRKETFQPGMYFFSTNCRKNIDTFLWSFPEDGKKISWHFVPIKGQKKSKSNFPAIDSSKKRTNEFVFLSWYTIQDRKTNSFVRFFEESMAEKFAFDFFWPLAWRQYPIRCQTKNSRILKTVRYKLKIMLSEHKPN